MIKPIQFTLSLFIFSLLTGCEMEQPRSEFTTAFKRYKIDLSYRLGDSFSVLRGKDTVIYNIHYNRKNRTTYILRSDKDTIFEGTVSKHRGMYLLNRLLPNGRYRISALKFTDSTVVGLETEYLQAFLIDKEIAKGNLASMIVDSSKQYVLEIDRKLGNELFSTILQHLDTEKLIIDRDYYRHVDYINSSGQVVNMPTAEESRQVLSVYPNPVEMILTIVKYSDQEFNYRIIDITGKEVDSGVLTQERTEVDFTHLAAGEYILTARETRESVKIIKK